MSRGRHGNPMLIGAFVLGAAALVVAALVIFGSGRFFRKQVWLVSYFSGSVNGLAVGAPVKFRGVPIGTVEQIRMALQVDTPTSQVSIPVWYTIDVDKVSEYRGAPFRLDRQRVDELVKAGLRAQLQTESFVTGVLYVGLDFVPDTPATLEFPDARDNFEIPAVQTTIERAMQTFDDIMKRLDRIDIEALVEQARSALEGVDKLARSPRVEDALVGLRETLASVRKVSDRLQPAIGQSLEKLDATTVQARTSLASLDDMLRRLEPQLNQTLSHTQSLLDPQAPLAVELTNALNELSETARTFRDLADYLDRNPNAILTGRPRP